MSIVLACIIFLLYASQATAVDQAQLCSMYQYGIDHYCGSPPIDGHDYCQANRDEYAKLNCGLGSPGGKSTDTSTSTAISPTERIDKWHATKFSDDIITQSQDLKNPGADITQADSQVLQSNALYDCVETSIEGRKDDLCKTNPGDPECVGLLGALNSATTCKEYFDPPSLGCKVYGKGDYTMAEWIAVGEQFHGSMSTCKAFKDEKESKDQDLTNYTQMLTFNPKQLAPDAPSLGNLNLTQSSVSGNIEDEPLKVNASGWENLAGKIADGASYLGYEDGDILRATGKGESYASIVSSSPFAEGLNAMNRQKLDEALEDSKMIADRVVQTSREKRGDSSPAEESAPGIDQGPESFVSSSNNGLVGVAEGDGIGVIRTGSSISAANNAVPPPSPGRSPASPQPASSSSSVPAAPKKPAHRLTEAERIEAIQRAAIMSRLTHEAYRAPAPAAKNAALAAPAEALTDLSLFQRVSLTYRKHSLWMNPLGEHSGDKLRSMAKPKIFREL